MRKRIQQLASGKFDYNGPKISLSTGRIELTVLEGKDKSGDFVITSTNHVKMRGIIYSSDPRMECLTPQFEGEEVRIRYQFHSEGLVEGDIQKGEFCIVCNQGEYNLSFVVFISKHYVESSIGVVKNLSDFTKLARESFEEAYQLFYSQHFKNILNGSDKKENLLYEAIKKEHPTGQKVEEFLAATGRKKPVTVELSASTAEFYEVNSNQKEQLELKKDQWGYVQLRITSDAEFLVPERKLITTEDFLGSACFCEYYIDESKLHAGKNYGKLSFTYPGGILEFFVCATRDRKKNETEKSAHSQVRADRIRLLQIYMDYRLKKIVTGMWAKQSVEILDHILAICPEESFYNLMKAQALIINKQKQEASWILTDYKRECVDRTTPEWGYYLYLCTLMEREESYVDRLAGEIEELFHRHPQSSLLFWILLFVKDEYYQNSTRRLKALEHWVNRGNDSPYLYLEAYYLFWQDPYLLTKLSSFEIKVLNWAVKQHAISKDIALQIMHIASVQRAYDPHIFKILSASYEVEQSDEMAATICAYLIKGQKMQKQYHKWFALGIEREIRITNLYEAFLVSMENTKETTVPKMIQMYFQYHNSLSYRQMAMLFAQVIQNKERQPEVYTKYRRTIEQFAMSQIEAGHMDENLAVIYEEMLPLGILNTELAYAFADLLFTHKLICKNAKIARVIVLQQQRKEYQVLTPIDGVTYFTAYSNDYRILMFDGEGNCYAKSSDYEDIPLMQPKRYLAQCMQLAPDALPYLIYYFSEKKSYEAFLDSDGSYFGTVLRSGQVREAYKAVFLPEVIRFYEKKDSDGMLGKYLENVIPEMLSPESRRYLIELLTEAHMFEKAYQMVHAFGYEYLGSAAKVALCSFEITECGFEEDDFLLGFAETTFESGKYNDVILIYLCKFYNGPTKQMARIWKAAGTFEIDTYDLSERIITQMLYSTDYVELIDKIYESYCSGGGKDLICRAYLSYFAHAYLLHNAVIPEIVFKQIEQRLIEEKETNEACDLAILKYYAEKEQMSEVQIALADRLLLTYTCKEVYFAFYKKLDKSLVKKYHLNDKIFLEYHTSPGTKVLINYSFDGRAYVQEEIKEVYDGIYVREFILFFGESLQYYIAEAKESGQAEVTESNAVNNNDIYGEQDSSKYAMLNEMFFDAAMQEKDALQKCMKHYYGMKAATEEIFKLL